MLAATGHKLYSIYSKQRLLISRGVICKRGKERGMRALVSIVQFYFITIQADLTVKKKKKGGGKQHGVHFVYLLISCQMNRLEGFYTDKIEAKL